MIDVLSSAAFYDRVHGPFIVDGEDIQKPLAAAPLKLSLVDLFTCVFDNTSARRDRLQCEDAPTMDPRRSNLDPEP